MQAFRYTAGYRPSGGLHPGSLTLTLLISGTIVSAMFFISPKFVRTVDPPFIGENIPIDPPPPIDPPKLQPKPKVEPQHKLFIPPVEQPFIRETPPPKIDFTANPHPPASDGGSGDAITLPAKIDPPKPPVMTGATLDVRFAANFQPTYPPDEIRAGREGRVTVRVLIGPDGRVVQVEKVAAASESFFEATRRRALDKWRFKPATRDGVPIESWQTLSVTFVLDGQQ